MDAVALDLTPCSVRLMKLKKTRHGLVPDFYHEVRFKKNYDLSLQALSPEDEKDVVEVLKKLKKDFRLEYVVSALPEEKNYIFPLSLPREAIGDMASAIRFSLEENVPLPASELNFDYTIAKKDFPQDTIDVVVSVFPKQIIKNYTDILALAGIKVISFQSESVSLVNAVVENGDDTPYLIARIMNDRVNAAIVENGLVKYTSTIRLNADDVVNDFKSPAATELKESLNKVLMFWFTSRPNPSEHQKIQDVLLVGKRATAEGFVDFLVQNLKVDVTVANIWKNNFVLDKYIPEMSRQQSLSYSVANGLALRAETYK